MTPLFRLGWVILISGLLAWDSPLRAEVRAAQPGARSANSFIPIPSEGKAPDAGDLGVLPQRLFRIKEKDTERAEGLFKEIMDNPLQFLGDKKALTSLAEAIKNGKLSDSKDPRFQELKKLLPGFDWSNPAKSQVSPQQVQQLQDLVKKLQNGSASPVSPPPSTGSGPGGNESPASPPNTEASTPADRRNAMAQAPLDVQPENKVEGTPLSRWVLRNAEWLSQRAGSLNNSPSLQEAIVELTQRKLPGADSTGAGRSSWSNQLADLVNQSFADQHWTNQALAQIKGLPWPSMSAVKLPNVKLPSGSMPSFSMPAPNLPAAPGGGSDVVFIVMGVISGGVLVAALAYWYKIARVRKMNLAHGLGPWPVDPQKVASRDELIRAFEYLSILKLGREARTWNHRWIAARMALAAAGDAVAAYQLASVYEQARYTPLSDSFPEEALLAARRDLHALAGTQAV
jgi:hypothetical protein